MAQRSIIGQRQLSNLCMERRYIDDRRCGGARLQFEDASRALKKLRAPLRYLIGIHVELLRQFRNRLFVAHCCQCHLRPEGRAVIAPGALLIPAIQADNPLSPLADSPSHLSLWRIGRSGQLPTELTSPKRVQWD